MIPKLLGLLVVAAAAVAAAITVNGVLLRNAAAGNDPVGRLSPRARLPPPPQWVVRPRTGHPRDEGADD